MFFDSWFSLFRICVVGTVAYMALVILLRFSGKRTLSKMNAFDFVVTVALGSTLATTLISQNVSFVSGVTALGLLVGLQYVVAWTSVRSRTFSRMVKSEPTLLFYNGGFLESAMKRERVVEGEIRSAIRAQGIPAIEEVEAVVLETDGTFTVLRKSAPQSISSISDVKKPEKVKREIESTVF